MPARSKKQQMAAGAALSAKRGERSASSLKGASRQMARSMSEGGLKKMASAKRKKLPTRKRKVSSGTAKSSRKSSGKSSHRTGRH